MHGGEYHGLVHISDWRPSLQALAGNKNAAVAAGFAFDGMDVWNAVLGNQSSPRTEILINIDEAPTGSDEFGAVQPPGGFPRQGAALRIGAWKLVVNVPNDTWYPVPTVATATPKSRCLAGAGACVWTAEDAAVNLHFGGDIGYVTRLAGNISNITGLFNIELDPQERRNVYLDHPDIVLKMTARLNYFRNRQIPNQNKDADPNATVAAAACKAWVPWLPTFTTCPTTWCEDIDPGCGPSTVCGQGSQALFLCSKTCKAC
jgi:hypothetical protein